MVIIAYFAFLINPFFSLIFVTIGLLRDRRNNVHYSALLAGIFACFAYWVIPKGEMDLTRYFEQVIMFGQMNWESFVDTILSKDFLYLQNLLFYGIGKTGNYHLLPTIVIFVSYFIMFYMITDYANKKKAKSSEILLAILFLICVLPFIVLVSNVRNILAFSIVSLGVYREFFQRKRNVLTIICYILPLFIHISTVALIILKLVAQNSSKMKSKNIITIVLSMAVMIFLFNNADALTRLPIFGEYISKFINKANRYIFGTTALEYVEILKQSTFSLLQKIYFILTIIFLLIVLKLTTKESSNWKLESYYKYISYIVIACIPIVLTVYFRFTMAVVMFAFLVIFGIKNIKNRDVKLLIYVCLIVIMLTGLIQQTIYFNKLAYIKDMFYNVVPRSIFTMFKQ